MMKLNERALAVAQGHILIETAAILARNGIGPNDPMALICVEGADTIVRMCVEAYLVACDEDA